MTSTNEGLPPTKWTATHTLTGTFSEAIASYVKVDNVATQICYTVISTGTNVKWDRAFFTPTGKYLGFRSTGEVDVIEKDWRTGVFIGGTNRDGGTCPTELVLYHSTDSVGRGEGSVDVRSVSRNLLSGCCQRLCVGGRQCIRQRYIRGR